MIIFTMKNIVCFIVSLIFMPILSSSAIAQKEIAITAIPSDAELYKIDDKGIETNLGFGKAIIRLQKEKEVFVELRKAGL